MKLSQATTLLWLTGCQIFRLCCAQGQKGLEQHEEFIGFTAWSQEIQYYGEGDRILFTGTEINEGGHYESSTSEFTCPVNGVYYVSLNLRRNDEYDVGVRLVQQRESTEQYILNLHSGLVQNPYSTVSNSLIFECQADDTIFVEGIDPTSDSLYGSESLPYSTFSIMLLYTTDQRHEALSGFSAYKLGIQEYESDDLINFNGVVYSDGNFAQAQSAYNCSAGGIYFVCYNLRSYGAEPMPAAVYVNGDRMLDIEVIYASNSAHTYTNAGLMECPEGGAINIRGEGAGAVFGGPSRFSTFNAFYLAQSAVGTQHDGVVGFSVYKSQIQRYSSDETIRFDGIIWDEMGYFDLINSEFVCPTNGIFYVVVNYYREDDYDVTLSVVRQETEIILRTNDYQNANPGIGVSNSGLTRCFSGDVIKVKSFDSGSVYGTINSYLTTFTVFMMYEY